MRKVLELLIFTILFGCDYNYDYTSKTFDENKINIYATNLGNYGRAFMLASAFSENVSLSTLAIGVTNANYPVVCKSKSHKNIEIMQLIDDFKKISDLVIRKKLNGNINLYLSLASVTSGEILTKEAFGSLDSIYVVPNGTSLFVYPDWRIDNIIKFAQKAKLYGVNSVKLIIWDSVDKKLLLKSNLQIARLERSGVDYEFVNFSEMSNKIKHSNTEGEVISAAIYSGAIEESVLSEPIFSESAEYNEDFKNIVLLGSYTIDDNSVSYRNQVEILTKLERDYNYGKYNIIFKGHPKDVSVNRWIENNSSKISYFKSFPYEIWQILGEGDILFKYNDEIYKITLPAVPYKIYSIFSSVLYGENVDKIELILGYNSVGPSGNLTKDIHFVTSSDATEYSMWKMLTGNRLTPFKMTYDWLNE